MDQAIIEKFDHKNLNVEVPEFKNLLPSVENIAMVIYRPFSQSPKPPASSNEGLETQKRRANEECCIPRKSISPQANEGTLLCCGLRVYSLAANMAEALIMTPSMTRTRFANKGLKIAFVGRACRRYAAHDHLGFDFYGDQWSDRIG